MNRKAFLLGFYATGGQVLLLRELVSSLNGDELFISIALFGWLIWVGLGAHLGGKTCAAVGSGKLFLVGVLLLPLSIIATRLSPLFLTDTLGEFIPLTTAGLVSVAATLPVGIVSGWLFASLARSGASPAESVVQVYLCEGVGAFVGGVIVMVLVGEILSTLGMSVVVGAVMAGGSFLTLRGRRTMPTVVMASVTLFLLAVATYAVPRLDIYLESIKYRSYRVEKSFDTHYGHQAILSREGEVVLLTDNTVEAVYPNLMGVENLLIPPLAYKPAARKVLLVGRSEFGVSQLLDSLPGLTVTAVDPRKALGREADHLMTISESVNRVDDDPMAFFASLPSYEAYDVIILNTGEPDSYRKSRLLTPAFLEKAKPRLKEDGILFVPTQYDTDRYVTSDAEELLSIASNVLRSSFREVAIWPGEMTLLLASDKPVFDIPYDTLISRLSRLGYTPQFICDSYLYDRLDRLKMERIRAATTRLDLTNTLERPVLPHYQAWYRAKTGGVDRKILSLIIRNPWWIPAVGLLVLVFLAATTRRGRGGRPFALFLYFTAGVVSLSLELVSFYVFQSSVGSLYSGMAALIGVFMLGLALGTYQASRTSKPGIEYCSLSLLLLAALMFLITYRSIPSQLLLVYHSLFLLATALATGGLFVAATRRYYQKGTEQNRGLGYACELVGSSVGALFSTTILLPVIGLHWLVISLVILVALTLLGSLLTPRAQPA